MERHHVRDFVDDRIKGRLQSLLRLYTSGTPGKAADMPKLDYRRNPGLWLGKSLASDEHSVGTSAGVRRCRSIWRRPEKQRWDRKMLTEMNGEPWNPVSPKDKAPQVRGVYITLERQIKHGGTESRSACFGQAKVHSAGMQGNDSRILWTMKLHRQQPRVQANQLLRPQDRQRMAPRPVEAVASTGCGWTRAGGCQHGSCRKLGSTADELCGPDVGG